ncbi:hypothetical protein ACIHFC_19195 [Streptomyces sp. NPDC052013]|uniref:hypothetical protein n=1 Tax=Streptomyces sp. NPDC052013 TaxID=3365679 RepID=UPI0037D639F3
MVQNTSRSSELPQPLRAVASGLRHLPGAEQVGKVAGGTLDRIGAVSPRGRRMAVYAGAGVLGAVGIVEWPVALTGAAVAWLTQPRPGPGQETRAPNGAAAAAESDDTHAPAATPAGPDPEPPADQGPGDRLASSRHRPGPAAPHVHEQPAKVGDTETASALKKVAEATGHHDPHTAHPPHGNGGRERTRDDRHTG